MYYVNNVYYPLNELHPQTGTVTKDSKLNGFEAAIHSAWKEVLKKVPPGERVVFRCPHIGNLTKQQGGSFPRRAIIKEETGTTVIVWCNTAIPLANGNGFEFKPANFNYVDRKSTRLNSSHITRSRMPSSA